MPLGLIAACLLTAAPQERVILHPDPEFKLRLPADYVDFTPKAEGSAYSFLKPNDDPARRIVVAIRIAAKEATQGREALTESTPGEVFEVLIDGNRHKRVKHEWNERLIDILEQELYETRVETVTYTAAVPLQNRAISVSATGTRSHRAQVFLELERLLKDLEGPSNWVTRHDWSAIRRMPYLTIGASLLFGAYGLFRLLLFRRRASRFRWTRAMWLTAVGAAFLLTHLLKPVYSRAHLEPPAIVGVSLWLAIVAIGLAAWNASLAARAGRSA